MEIEGIDGIELATEHSRKEALQLGVSILFLTSIRAAGADAVFHDPRHDAAMSMAKNAFTIHASSARRLQDMVKLFRNSSLC